MYKREDSILSVNLTERGKKAALKRLAKKKKTYPKSETPDDFYIWWVMQKERKKKDKIAMCIMAYQYPVLVMHLDQHQLKVLQLENKTKSQEEQIHVLKQNLQQEKQEVMQLQKKLSTHRSCLIQLTAKTEFQEQQIALLKLKLQQEEEKNTQLNDEMYDISNTVLKLRSRTESQKKNITELQQKVQEAQYETLEDGTSSRLPVPLNIRSQRSFSFLLMNLPDLQYDHSNYEFWMKIKKWLCNGEVTPLGVFKLVQKKLTPKAWQYVENKFENIDLTEKAFSNPIKAGRLLENLWKCVSEAMGPGTKHFKVYYQRRQEPGETFDRYLEEKFKLYCSYGVDTREPNRNDLHFLCNVVEKAKKCYGSLITPCPESYAELLTRGMLINSMLTTAEWNNQCLNCKRQGHTQAQCRRPGGDAEVGPNQCYTCGGYGHWARKCWTRAY